LSGIAGRQSCAANDVVPLTVAGRRGNYTGQIRDPVGEEPVDDSKTQREQRLAVALRANLHRRKQQARQRAESDAPRDDAPQDPADTGSAAPDAGGSRGKT
jgi:hypothetical protein